jgi:Ca-activated chloride channel family protein
MRHRPSSGVTAVRALAIVIVAGVVTSICSRESKDSGGMTSDERWIDEQLAPATSPPQREGLAAAIVIDVSGSMDEMVRGEGGQNEPKIAIARRAAQDLVDQFARYAGEHPGEPVLLGLYEFSERGTQSDCRPIVPMGPPDRARASRALESVRADGGTPIGSAMIVAKRELDTTGLSRRHLLVVTDGENTTGVEPQQVTAAIGRRPELERPSIYFVAFDIAASRFSAVRDAGGLVLAAANAKELNDTLDSLLRGKILIEK